MPCSPIGLNCSAHSGAGTAHQDSFLTRFRCPFPENPADCAPRVHALRLYPRLHLAGAHSICYEVERYQNVSGWRTGGRKVMTGGANAGGTRTPSSNNAAPRRALIVGELERILSSPVFGRSPRHRAFLRHIVDATLNGE